MSHEILCVGEILWDALPEGLFLGGAPFNVACHLQALGQTPAFASRVGNDRLGEEALRRMRARGLATDLLQTDDTLPTGFVKVELGGSGVPDYEILEPAAWDAIALTDPLRERAAQAEALVFGSLAQRSLTSRRTLQRLCEAAALRVFDINLRPPFIDRSVVERSLKTADVVKCNDEELHHLRDWFDLPDDRSVAVPRLARMFDASTLCVTGGDDGAWLWRDGASCHHPGYAVEVADTVGAGDAFLSALLTGLLTGHDGTPLLDLANRLGAYVASRAGAFPSYTFDGLDDLRHLDLQPRTVPESE